MVGVEGEHSKPLVPGEAGEEESKLEQPGPSCQAVSIREQTPKIQLQHSAEKGWRIKRFPSLV